MNTKVWAKLKLKRVGSTVVFLNPEKSDISDLRIFEIYEVSDEFTLVQGDKIYLYNTPNTIEYLGQTNNSMLFRYDWMDVKGYATIPFNVNEIRICVAVDENVKVSCPIITNEEYGTDLNYGLDMFKTLIDKKELPKVVEPSPSSKYLYLDTKYTMFLNEDVIREQVEGKFYKIDNLKYGVFVRISNNIPEVTEIYCEKGYEKSLTDMLIKMVNGEFEEKVKIASL